MTHEELLTQYSTATETFCPFLGLRIDSIWCMGEEGYLEKIVLKFENESLVIKAEDDDTIRLARVPNLELNQVLETARPGIGILAEYVGHKFGWGWLTINQQDYLDGVLLSFDDIRPNLHLNVIASSLYVFEVKQVENYVG